MRRRGTKSARFSSAKSHKASIYTGAPTRLNIRISPGEEIKGANGLRRFDNRQILYRTALFDAGSKRPAERGRPGSPTAAATAGTIDFGGCHFHGREMAAGRDRRV